METLEQTPLTETQATDLEAQATEPATEAQPTTEATPVEATPAEAAEEPQTQPETEAEPETEASAIPPMKTKEEVVARAQELAHGEEIADKQEIDLLKQLFYRYHNADVLQKRQDFIDGGGDPMAYVPEPDEQESVFKDALQIIRQRRTDLQAALEKERQENLAKRLAIMEKIKELATTPEEANKSYETFRELQSQWHEIGPVPAENVTETWKNYQLYVEQFYDMLKLNSEMREYDFRKNLEAKTVLCEQAEKLADDPDVIGANNKLQNLHQEWKEIGPVSKELREEIWNRFREASTIVRKRHQEFFENRKAQEEENLKKKTELCEQAEAIPTEELKTFAQWDEQTKAILALQATWKTIGFAPAKHNNQIFDRFRTACDRFFQQKNEFFHQLKDSLNKNLQQKTALAEQAEALKDSTDWKKTTDQLVELQKQWKQIGAVPRKVSDQLWKRFTSACDAFFEAKSQAHAGQRAEQQENLKTKQGIIEQLKALIDETEEGAAQKLRELQKQWNETGHVPMRNKDKVYEAYHQAVDALYKKFNLSQTQRRLSSFKTSLKVTAENGQSNLVRERERMQRAYDIMKNEIQTYENNLNFLSVSSKKGNSLVAEITKKVDKLKDELELLGQKIKALNETIRQEQNAKQ